MDDNRVRGIAGVDCRDGVLSAYAHVGGVACVAWVCCGTHTIVGGRDDCGGVGHAAGRTHELASGVCCRGRSWWQEVRRAWSPTSRWLSQLWPGEAGVGGTVSSDRCACPQHSAAGVEFVTRVGELTRPSTCFGCCDDATPCGRSLMVTMGRCSCQNDRHHSGISEGAS